MQDKCNIYNLHQKYILIKLSLSSLSIIIIVVYNEILIINIDWIVFFPLICSSSYIIDIGCRPNPYQIQSTLSNSILQRPPNQQIIHSLSLSLSYSFYTLYILYTLTLTLSWSSRKYTSIHYTRITPNSIYIND